MNYVALALTVNGVPRDGILHTYAGQRTDRDAGKVTGCGLILPKHADVYTHRAAASIPPHCGDCFPDGFDS